MHWEPVFPLSDPQPGGGVDCSGLAVDTAHLLTKWSLRCLVEDTHDEKRTESFLRWLDTTVIKHKEIVALVLRDAAMSADVLRLYHRSFETDTSISSRELFQLFTNIMLSLLESRGHLPELHQAVVAACLPEVDCDPSRRGETLCSHDTKAQTRRRM